jgi:chromosome segregation ATPase
LKKCSGAHDAKHLELEKLIKETAQRMGPTNTQAAVAAIGDANKEVQKIQEQFQNFQEQLRNLDQELRTVNEQSAQRDEALTLQFSILDTQYNNISTRALADQIIGNLEQYYPAQRQITADIKELVKKYDEKSIELAKTAKEVGEVKERVLKLESDSRAGVRVVSVTKDRYHPGPEQQEAKKRKITNGHFEVSKANGYTNGGGSNA